MKTLKYILALGLVLNVSLLFAGSDNEIAGSPPATDMTATLAPVTPKVATFEDSPDLTGTACPSLVPELPAFASFDEDETVSISSDMLAPGIPSEATFEILL